MQGRLPPPAEQPSPVVAVPSDDLRQCMGTCPAGACAVKTAVDGYAGRYAPELELSFQRAVTEGFDALWQFGEGVARSIWPEGERRADAPFCTVMAVAGRMGMVERDMQVLRRNMARLRANQRQGGLS
jgi:hypothetical protein